MELDFEPLDMALDAAGRLGAEGAEAILVNELGLDLKVFDGRIEKFSHSDAVGLGLRVFKGGRPGRAYTSDLSLDSMKDTARLAIDSASVTPVDEHRALPGGDLFPQGAGDGSILGEELGMWADDIESTPADEKIEFALGLERLAREHDPRVSGVETSAYSESTMLVALSSTNGFRAGYRSSLCYGYLVAIACGADDTQTGFGFTVARSIKGLDPEGAALEAASRAVDLLGARQVETARVPVLLDNLSSAELVGAVGASLSGESAVKGRTFLAGRVGETIAAEGFTVVDDGQKLGGFGTAPFDSEGVAASRKAPVERGVLKTFLHNCYTASRMGVESTGNAGRTSHRSPVSVMPMNLYIEPGIVSPDELRSGIQRGLEVCELQGVHIGLNPVTGDVSLGARGWWIEGGKRAYPVREVTIAGTIDGILGGIGGIADDLRFVPEASAVGAPSLLINEIVVSGK